MNEGKTFISHNFYNYQSYVLIKNMLYFKVEGVDGMKRSEVLACLDHVPIFDALNEHEKNELAKIARHESFNKNDIIYASGDSLHALYVVHDGSVNIVRYTSEGREQVLNTLTHGDFFGEMSLFGFKSVDNYAVVSKDAVICKIDRQAFSKMLTKMTEVSHKMLAELSIRIQKLEETITFNNLKTAEAKLAKYLLDNQVNDLVTLKTTKTIISATLGITPETFSRRLKSLEERGCIKIISNKKIKLIDKNYFEELIYL